MGCTPSSIVPSDKTEQNDIFIANNNGYKRTERDLIETPEKNLIKKATSATGANTVLVKDETTDRPPYLEQSSSELPLVAFGDGRLGVTDENNLKDLKKTIQNGELYFDPEFPASNKSLYFVDKNDKDIVWKRPKELRKNPQMFVSGVDRKDVIQGILGDCWFLSSCAAVAMTPKLIERVIPSDQKLVGPEYNGLITCRFWRFGKWTHVCIDDLLPTKDGQLIYARCADDNEFWVALLEKAYAKIHGTYQALEGGQSMDAMIDLTGGLAERYDIEDSPDQKKLFRYLSKASKTGAFITASRKGDWRTALSPDVQGLVEGHAYTMSGVAVVDHQKRGMVPLVRLRNPFGNHVEWTGSWSDGDRMWDFVPNNVRKKLLTDNRFDGEFWMSFGDFYNEFEEISLCMMGPDFDQDGMKDKVGQVTTIKGEWVPGVNAGGSRNDLEKFAMNPQFLLAVTDSLDEEDDDLLGFSESPDTTPILIGLMQEHRQSTKTEGVKLHQIGFCVYQSHIPGKRLNSKFFQYNYDEGTSGTYINYREVICRLELRPGNYIIIPASYEPNTPGKFMIRVYSPKEFALSNLG